MKNKAFTLVELLIVITIALLLISIIFGTVRNGQSGSTVQYDAYLYPKEAQAQAQQQAAEQLRIQNELLREQIELKKQELEKK